MKMVKELNGMMLLIVLFFHQRNSYSCLYSRCPVVIDVSTWCGCVIVLGEMRGCFCSGKSPFLVLLVSLRDTLSVLFVIQSVQFYSSCFVQTRFKQRSEPKQPFESAGQVVSYTVTHLVYPCSSRGLGTEINIPVNVSAMFS